MLDGARQGYVLFVDSTRETFTIDRRTQAQALPKLTCMEDHIHS